MIYQLVKRDISWKAAGVLACLCPLAALFGLWQPGQPSGFFLFWLFSLVLLTLLPANRRCTSFEAALPIAGWDLYCARLLSNLILIWIPVFGGPFRSCCLPGRSTQDSQYFSISERFDRRRARHSGGLPPQVRCAGLVAAHDRCPCDIFGCLCGHRSIAFFVADLRSRERRAVPVSVVHHSHGI